MGKGVPSKGSKGGRLLTISRPLAGSICLGWMKTKLPLGLWLFERHSLALKDLFVCFFSISLFFSFSLFFLFFLCFVFFLLFLSFLLCSFFLLLFWLLSLSVAGCRLLIGCWLSVVDCCGLLWLWVVVACCCLLLVLLVVAFGGCRCCCCCCCEALQPSVKLPACDWNNSS